MNIPQSIKQSVIILAFFSLCIGCVNDDNEKTVLYQIHQDKSGPNIQIGDMIAISTIQRTEEGVVLTSSYDNDDRPVISFRRKSLFKGDLNAALGLLSEGDSASFKISIDSLKEKDELPISINTKGKFIIYEVKVNRVVPRGNANDSLYTTKFEELRKELAIKEKYREGNKIRQYLAKKRWKPAVTASGLYYVVNQQGKGTKAVPGDSVSANYTGFYLSGKPYLTTYENVAKKANLKAYDMLTTQVGKGKSLAGLEEAFMTFPKGTKVTLLLPSKLAYNEYYHQGIEPYTPLLFEMEIMDIKPFKR
jgi:FKBP-type peptidyl-prolyl cis-trans isomerase FkpA